MSGNNKEASLTKLLLSGRRWAWGESRSQPSCSTCVKIYKNLPKKPYTALTKLFYDLPGAIPSYITTTKRKELFSLSKKKQKKKKGRKIFQYRSHWTLTDTLTGQTHKMYNMREGTKMKTESESSSVRSNSLQPLGIGNREMNRWIRKRSLTREWVVQEPGSLIQSMEFSRPEYWSG